MTVYVVMVHGPEWDKVIGVALDVESARHIVHGKQDATESDHPLLESEHIAVHIMDTDRRYEVGP